VFQQRPRRRGDGDRVDAAATALRENSLISTPVSHEDTEAGPLGAAQTRSKDVLSRISGMTKASLFIVLGAALVASTYSSVNAQGPSSVNEGIYTAAQADRGKAVYAMNCAGCPGGKAEGGTAGPTLREP